ncbi:MAG TPA: outer membrane beta-barrel protein [Thermoanaerobaculia bacterium]|nr:outer membrane beta-barrel protein [Thermoanaerobaculia bacterium]
MKRGIWIRCLLGGFLLAASAPLAAQPAYRGEPRLFRHEIQLQAYLFNNFFQARGGAPEEDVRAAGVEYGVAYRREENAPDFFGALYAINYAHEGTKTTFGGRIGGSYYGSRHSFYGYLDHMQNGWAFDVEETTANADITALLALYSYRVHPDWQVGLNGYNEWLSFDVDTGYEGDYYQMEGEVRYRGFGSILEPRIGYAVGRRNVENDRDSYDHRHWFVELSTEPHPNVDLSARYRRRTRDYRTVEREEDRPQIRVRAVFRHNERISWIMQIIREDVDSSLPGRDFETSRVFAGVMLGF